jgi:hypothetical protein
MPEIAARTSNQRRLTSSRIGAQIVSVPDPGKVNCPDLRFHRADDRVHDFDGRAMDPIIKTSRDFRLHAFA